MLDKKLTKIGRITITEGQIRIEGFEADDCMCRETAILAEQWAAKKLLDDSMATISEGGGGIASVDPHRYWRCAHCKELQEWWVPTVSVDGERENFCSDDCVLQHQETDQAETE